LIEAYTYRMGDHTTSDDAARYRSKEEVREWERKDPIVRFRLYLGRKGLWDEAREKAVQDAATEFVEKAVAEAEARPPATPDDLFAYTYATMPPDLEAQLVDFQAFLAEGRR
jgi:pyruvate dehydrogenase E1 component alpha subunit